MKNLLFLLFCALSTVLSAQQILSVSPEFVDNTTEFSTLQAAVDAAADGAMIYVFPGGYNEAVVIEDKSLYLVGPGYSTAQNYSEIPVTADAYFSQNFTIQGTGNVIVEGLHFRSLLVKNTNVTQVKRSRIQRLTMESCVANFQGIYVAGYYYISNSHTDTQMRAYGDLNVTFSNSIFPDSYSNGTRNALLWCNPSLSYGLVSSGQITFDRCFFRNFLNFGGKVQAIVTNCLAYSAYGTWQSALSGSVFTNSIRDVPGTSTTSFLYGVDFDDVFVGYPSNPNAHSFDKRYQLKPNSPARGFATDGGDCGPYGGPNPYVPSGLPSIPLIYGFEAEETGTTGGGLPVNVKVRTQN